MSILKLYYLFTILIIIASSGCEKDSGTSTSQSTLNTPPRDPVWIEVLEKTSKKPIEGASVLLEKCSKYDNQFGCTGYSTITTLTTNGSGRVNFVPPMSLESYQVQHQNYYTIRQKNGSVGSATLTPKCAIKVSIKRVKTYSPNDILFIAVGDPDCPAVLCWARIYRMGLPNDTTFYADGQGNSNNQVRWYINNSFTNTSPPLPAFYLNGFDSASVNIQY